jgi:hypothetical protein
MCNRLKE